MDIKDFDTSVLSTRVVFNKDTLKPGQFIVLYKVYRREIAETMGGIYTPNSVKGLSEESEKLRDLDVASTGLVVEVDGTMLTYTYVSANKPVTDYIPIDDMFNPDVDIKNLDWKGAEYKFIIRVVQDGTSEG